MDWLGPAATVAAGFLGRSKSSKAGLALARDQFDYQRRLQHKKIQYTVADAKKAGLHPLFALGAGSTSFSPTSYIPGQSETGSFASDAATAIGDWAEARQRSAERKEQRSAEEPLKRAQLELLQAQKERTIAERDLAASQAARVAQSSNVTRPAVTYPLVESAQQANPFSPVETVPQKVHADRGVIKREGKGSRPHWDEETWGEGGPIATMVYPWLEYMVETLQDWTGGDRRPFRPGVKHPRAFYHYWKRRLGAGK